MGIFVRYTVEVKRVRAPLSEETGNLLEDWLQHHTDERARGGALVGMLSLRCRSDVSIMK